ncbi:MAG: type II toxin-antitoxin system prevent-host-death family antitoxin [Opitutales bacterium]|nr:type II toxin-antitoxin system prevent-host-death family antitoxin [Opitutales bacterium]
MDTTNRPTKIHSQSRPEWKLEDAKARFSEVVRRAQEGPQHVTVRGRNAAVVVSAEYFEQILPESRKKLSALMRSSPLHEVEFGKPGSPMPVREVEL